MLKGQHCSAVIARNLPGLAPAGETDAPEIDGVVYVGGENLSVGSMVPVTILEAREYDIVGVVSEN